MLRRLNGVHAILLLALPIFLALINSNWLFNLSFSHDYIIMVDDYIYTGYQMAFPQYVGWFPSDTLYFIERMSWILPGYLLNQVASPLVAHLILHLGLYYLATFSVYGILSKLLSARVGLIVAILFGQYPLIMRSLGWNYVDGFSITCMLLSILWLTYATGSRWRPIYLVGAGMSFVAMVIANTFYGVYALPMILYFLILDRTYRHPKQFIFSIIYSVIGMVVVYTGLSLYYQQFTNQILFTNLLTSAVKYTQDPQYFLSYHYSGLPPNWHVFLVFIVVLVLITFLRQYRHLSSEMRRVVNALTALFLTSYAIILVWTFAGFLLTHAVFYNTHIVMSAFLMLGAIIYKPISDLSSQQFRWMVLCAVVIPLAPFLMYTFSPTSFDFDVLAPILFIGVVVCSGIFLVIRHSFRANLAVIVSITGCSMLVAYLPHIQTYVADRYRDQIVFEDATAIAQTINARYPRLSMNDFRLWYDFSDPKLPTFHAVASIYLWTQGRNARLNEAPPLNSFFEADQIIILSSLHDKDTLLQMAGDTIENRGIITFIDELVVNDIRMVILNVRLALATNDWLTYYFSDTQEQYVLYESGWNGYEQVAQNSRPFRWTAEPTARLILDVSGGWFDATARYRVSFVIAGYLEDEVVNSLTLMVNGVSVPLERSDNKYVGQISGQYLLNPTLELVFQTDRVSNPFDLGIQDGRKLGVAIGELIIDRMIEND